MHFELKYQLDLIMHDLETFVKILNAFYELQDSVRFASQMQSSIKVLCQLLGSKVSSDILETIDFFISANEFGLADVEQGTRKMLALIWSRDAAVKEAVVNAYRKLYIEPRHENQKYV